MFVTRNGGDLVARFHQHWKDDPDWNWRATSKELDLVRQDGHKRATRISTVISWFGFKASPTSHTVGLRHLVLDPVTFYGRDLNDIWPGPETVIERLLAWGIQIRNWTYENGLELRPTNGAVSSQLLRDSRFYPDARRKVSRGLNERARDNLPGNHYRLFQSPDNAPRKAIYLDQTRAHHYHAERILLPHADTLVARGNFLTLDGDCHISTDRGFHGLYYLRYRTPSVASRMAFTWFGDSQKPDTEYDGFVYSNEIETLTDLGYKILRAIACWGGPKRDSGIARIARWSQSQLDDHGSPAWLKPILLSTYGVLATRPKHTVALYGRAKKGVPATLDTGALSLHGILVGATSGHKIEPGFANVLHRGMIEAATRAESLGYAHYLTGKGYNVLSIYADAVIIEDDEDKPLPLQIDPWRIKERLTDLQFKNMQAFTSDQMTKLPGVAGRQAIKDLTGRAPRYDRIRNSTQWKAIHDRV